MWKTGLLRAHCLFFVWLTTNEYDLFHVGVHLEQSHCRINSPLRKVKSSVSRLSRLKRSQIRAITSQPCSARLISFSWEAMPPWNTAVVQPWFSIWAERTLAQRETSFSTVQKHTLAVWLSMDLPSRRTWNLRSLSLWWALSLSDSVEMTKKAHTRVGAWIPTYSTILISKSCCFAISQSTSAQRQTWNYFRTLRLRAGWTRMRKIRTSFSATMPRHMLKSVSLARKPIWFQSSNHTGKLTVATRKRAVSRRSLISSVCSTLRKC